MTRDEAAPRHACIGEGCTTCVIWLEGYVSGQLKERKSSQVLVAFIEEVALGPYKDSDTGSLLDTIVCRSRKVLKDYGT